MTNAFEAGLTKQGKLEYQTKLFEESKEKWAKECEEEFKEEEAKNNAALDPKTESAIREKITAELAANEEFLLESQMALAKARVVVRFSCPVATLLHASSSMVGVV